MSEPKLHTFLDPCVDELNGSRKGILLSTSLSPVPLRIVAALLCVAADIPATRKVCGFVSHPACLSFSLGASGKRKTSQDFRVGVSHKRNCERLKTAKFQSEYGRLSILYGVHYCALCKLEYFDCVRFHVIDPMHNLFLGTAKYVFKLWAENVFSNGASEGNK